MLGAIAGSVGKLFLDKFQPDRGQLQRMIGKGPAIKQMFTDQLLDKISDWMNLLLKPGISVPVPATEETVITPELLCDRFNIKWTGPNFDRLFMGKTIPAAPAGNMLVNELQKDATLAAMFEHVGDNGRVPLGQALWHVGQQFKGPKDKPGPLLVNGWVNFFFVEVEVKSGKTETWAVRFHWNSFDEYWYARADPLDDPDGRSADNQVLSRRLL